MAGVFQLVEALIALEKLVNPEPVVFTPQPGFEPARPSFLYRYPKNQRLAKQLVEKAAVWGACQKRSGERAATSWIYLRIYKRCRRGQK
jgi:hypothetical protein